MNLQLQSNNAQRSWQVTLGLVGLTIAVAFGVLFSVQPKETDTTVSNVACEETLSINGNSFECVERVDQPDERTQGLSGTTDLLATEGMLFEFDDSGQYGFWMKNMNYPIDILWLDEDGVIVDIESNVQPESYPESFVNESPARYVLELAAGQAAAVAANHSDRVLGVTR